MQIFIPLLTIQEIAECLDNQRLGKQRLECQQVINIIRGTQAPNAKTGRIAFANHPIIDMWRPYLSFLKFYFNTMVKEWIKRGFKNSLTLEDVKEEEIVTPSWWGLEEIHSTHRANLVRKLPSHYKVRFGFKEDPANGYLWILADGSRLLIENTNDDSVRRTKRTLFPPTQETLPPMVKIETTMTMTLSTTTQSLENVDPKKPKLDGKKQIDGEYVSHDNDNVENSENNTEEKESKNTIISRTELRKRNVEPSSLSSKPKRVLND
ncbi:unnamed protein product [Didymodactylos carnosus]|uniref:Uncharacterized protein n=1 Tax=Didymodactylos carnosus TaxID=1234261 RepID=A0A814IH92_9BILA|nr:unnamed protein product [Didymodactylos carnosus]CAF1418623.1 unnamed protein product [Didymodactylos carnosus]CAF3795342.1 unnamed protein product [Didymodactylos carnosus]CAF4220240.1 unnamed protein product [Didymodactylos carnosus]